MSVVGSTPLWLLLVPEDEEAVLLLLVLCELGDEGLQLRRGRRRGRRLCMLLRSPGTTELAMM
jgi:hypothetical protein